ncbi:MAG: GH3 auxin-responsive promoter family protein [Bacteroidales bacterium]|nr:GH3 auxin-responsive promoter family protein [Bacteroidales bacterium]MBN2757543.1 GH3 auxin-responsive promoter family protein [Bacteroidales bacterium]
MAFIHSVISWATIKRMNQIELFEKYPEEVQNEQLFNIVNTAKNTEFGKQYDFESISNMQKFKERVPIFTYETFVDYIEKVRKGKQNVIWPTEIKWFAKSSGTTADKSKFIPVSEESLEDCHFRGGRDIIVLYTSNFPGHSVFTGKALAIGGSQQINRYQNDMYYGDLSAVLIENLPFWVRLLQVPDKKIALMEEWEKKIEMMAQSTSNENVTNISGVPSWTLVLIKRILEITGKTNLIDVWPNLELFVHGGVSFNPYREQYKELIVSDTMNYLETYNASEGFFAIQDYPNSDGMLLMLDYGVFYEFIPMEHFYEEKPDTLSLDQVEIDKNYALVISTNGGLWRYVIGDTIKFTSKYPFRIKITGRTKHFINAFGEELIIDNAEIALKKACERTGAKIKEYTAAPIYMTNLRNGGHQWLFEFSKMPDNLEHFIEILDTTLKSVNSDYEAKRYKNISLSPPEIVIAKEGLFYNWLKERGRLGGQNKVPRLANSREFIDRLLEINKILK